jgi:hypothetical protein
VIDADDAFGYFGDLRNERPVDFPGNTSISEAWYRFNGWIWDRNKVDIALARSRRTVFVCGGAKNEASFYDRFSKIFRLHLDPETLKDRLTGRSQECATNNPVWIRTSLRSLDFNGTEPSHVIPIRSAPCSVQESTDAILAHVTHSVPEDLLRRVISLARRVYLLARHCWRRLVGTNRVVLPADDAPGVSREEHRQGQ